MIDLFPERQLVSSSRGPESNLIEIKFRSKLSDNPGNNFREKIQNKNCRNSIGKSAIFIFEKFSVKYYLALIINEFMQVIISPLF